MGITTWTNVTFTRSQHRSKPDEPGPAEAAGGSDSGCHQQDRSITKAMATKAASPAIAPATAESYGAGVLGITLQKQVLARASSEALAGIADGVRSTSG